MDHHAKPVARDAQRNTNLARLRGLRVAVTGGTSGLGRALVGTFARHGARVAFLARHEDGVRRTRADVPGTFGISADVGRKEDIHPAALQITGWLGGVDVLVNNASALGPVPLALLADTDCEALEEALAVNVLGPFRLTRTLFGALAASAREGRGAVVVNVSSDAAVSAYPRWGAYGASKAALAHLTRIWDAEAEGLGVRFLALDPGDMDTPLHALAIPDADRDGLRHPEDAAIEIVEAIVAALPAPTRAAGAPPADRAAQADADFAWGVR